MFDAWLLDTSGYLDNKLPAHFFRAFPIQLSSDELHIWHQGCTVWERFIYSGKIWSIARRIQQNRNETLGGGRADSARAWTASCSITAAGTELFQAVCFCTMS